MKKTNFTVSFYLITFFVVLFISSCNDQKSEEQKLDEVEAFIENNNFDSANIILKDILIENPKRKRALYFKALILYANNKEQDALLKISEILLIDSSYSNAYYLRSLIKINAKDRYGSSIDCDKALLFDSTNVDALFIKGQFEEMNGNLQSALIYFKKVLAKKTNDTTSLMVISKILIRLDDRNMACDYLYKASNLGCKEAIKIIPSACNDKNDNKTILKKENTGVLYRSEKHAYKIFFPKNYSSQISKFPNIDILMVASNGKKQKPIFEQFFGSQNNSLMCINVEKINDSIKPTIYDLSIDEIKTTLSKLVKDVNVIEYGYSNISKEPALWYSYTSDKEKYFYLGYSIVHDGNAYTFTGRCDFSEIAKKKEFINTIETLEFIN